MTAQRKQQKKKVRPKKGTAGSGTIPPFRLADEKLIMRPFGREELYSDEYLRWMNDPEVTKTIGRYDYLMPVREGNWSNT